MAQEGLANIAVTKDVNERINPDIQVEQCHVDEIRQCGYHRSCVVKCPINEAIVVHERCHCKQHRNDNHCLDDVDLMLAYPFFFFGRLVLTVACFSILIGSTCLIFVFFTMIRRFGRKFADRFILIGCRLIDSNWCSAGFLSQHLYNSSVTV